MARRAALGAILLVPMVSVLVSAGTGENDRPSERLVWMLADKGPFRRAHDFSEFSERHQHGFSTRYKIYREFGRWKVNNLVTERQEAVPFDPEFTRSVRQLGRRPSLQTITDSIIKKYGTHFLLSATLGGEESLTIFVDKRKLGEDGGPGGGASNLTLNLETLHQLAASYFIDRDSTLTKLHHLQITSTAVKVTETRTGPLGCSNYDNLDSVSSVLVHSPENRVQLQGLQVLLPEYLRSRFVQAALSYVGCSGEGRFTCRDGDCWCRCDPGHPECNCPRANLRAQQSQLKRVAEAWNRAEQEFEQSDEFQSFVGRLLIHVAQNASSVRQAWRSNAALLRRHRRLENDVAALQSKARQSAAKLFSFSRRCRTRPTIVLPRERRLGYWLQRTLSLLYCGDSGVYSEPTRTCVCPGGRPSCQGPVPCLRGGGGRCASCSPENRTRCSSCNDGYALSQGTCRPAAPSPTKQYLATETETGDSELQGLLGRLDADLAVPGVFVSGEIKLGTWFEPSWRRRTLLTLRSNRSRSARVHVLLGLSVRICAAQNATLEPVLSVSVNPFGGSHSESWAMPVNQGGYPDWKRTMADPSRRCQNWTLTLGNRWRSFFETVHLYLRTRTQSGDDPDAEASRGSAHMKITGMQLFGYAAHFDPEAIRDLILQLDYPYTLGSRDSALQELMEIQHRVNRLSPPGPTPLDLFSCLLRQRLKLSSSDVARILLALQAFRSRSRYHAEYEAAKLCS